MMDNTLVEFANALPDGLILYNQNFNVVWCNNITTSLLQLSDSLVGSLVLDLLPSYLHEEFRFDNVGEFQFPLYQQHILMTQRKYTHEYSLLIVKDITHTHKLEAIRQDFVANVSHELRTPLTVFHGYLSLLQDQESVPKQKLRDILGQMAGQVDRMERLVEDLLLLSKLECYEPDQQHHSSVAVTSLLRDVLIDAESLSDGQHYFESHFDEGVVIQGQQDELRSVFSNLIFNAVRYTPSPGKIEVTWTVEKGLPVFEVKDNGIGIPQKHIARITQRFYQVDKSRTYRGIGGTGLGLAIVKHVLIRHGAELEVFSEIGKGSIFRCVFTAG